MRSPSQTMLILLLLPTHGLAASNIQSGGGVFGDSVYDMAVDGDGSAILCGHFLEQATYGNLVIQGSDTVDGLVVKFDAAGAAVCAAAIGGSGTWDIAWGVDTDADGNIYVAGRFDGVLSFGHSTLTSHGQEDGYVAKIDRQCSPLWIRQFGGMDNDSATAIAVHDDTVVITGGIGDQAAFESHILGSTGGKDMFVASYDVDGNLIWVASAGGIASDSGYGVDLDSQDGVYVVGEFSDEVTFGDTTISSYTDNDYPLTDVFLSKLSLVDGSFIWTQQIGGLSSDRANAIDIDDSGGLVITGTFKGPANFGSLHEPKITAGYSDIYVSAWDLDGNPQWVQSSDGSDAMGSRNVAIGPQGGVYAVGQFSGSVTFGHITLFNTGAVLNDAFLVHYNSHGQVIDALGIGGVDDDSARAVAVSDKHGFYLTGVFESLMSIGQFDLLSQGYQDVFLVRLCVDK